MIKSILILIIFPILLFSSQQIILVVANNFNTSHAYLELIEDNKLLYSTTVNIGTRGLGWGLGEYPLTIKKSEPLKYEGDRKAPAGIFKLTNIFGYAQKSNYKLPYLFASKQLICVDDSHSNFYKKIIEQEKEEKSFEKMKRQDQQYKFGVTVAHNKNALAERGSCIFLHIQRDVNASTAGCTSMREKDLKIIVNWIDKTKNPLLIQIAKSSAKEVLQLFPQLKVSKLLAK